ncbi:DUF3421 domain containing protein [Asbolus verrucosus]|uniref:DUF3421 domain containing protein n=1 Tax=Asbolus verrucosus TaxID=1661398 RepID=A0A482V7K0_ASBVE|nr:DUF3421 domain containing protein [Asbolus verrucosus]
MDTCMIVPATESVMISSFDVALKSNPALHAQMLSAKKDGFKWMQVQSGNVHLLPKNRLVNVEFSNGNCSYYWKNYNGDTPDDAVPGGQEPKGEVFYIGLVHLKLINEIFAGMIVPSAKSARITSLGVTRDVRNDPFTIVNILCSSDKEAFEWVATKNEDLHLLDENILVEGGKVLGQDLYIGRVRLDTGVVLGKVFPYKFIYQGLYVPLSGTFAHYLSYEVLTFDCERNKRNKTEFDVRIDNNTEILTN